MSEWMPTDTDVMQFFTDGTDQFYSLTANPAYWDGKAAFRRWLTEHDRRIAEQAWTDGWEEGQHSAECWYTGNTEAAKTAKTLEDNPYCKEDHDQ
ncbi:hypothetical protein [Bifidobacterium olomucense]|uniref:Uncharacterized protein n=1 Tax=Bifidobacterium olomucense TaxID=2675324 RepID=A0A7Y0F1E6_9BIFI|nr:hypothetical protein [Bifidobacterium sp. DSM 109959]NMM99281.1 hypothetical protein [Bifidobacterium sp. DSM 109959]